MPSGIVELMPDAWRTSGERAAPPAIQATARDFVLLQLHALLLFATLIAFAAIRDWHLQILQAILLFAAATLIYLGAVARFSHLSGRMLTASLLAWAILFRLFFALDPLGPHRLLSGDLYRYLWEGRVVQAGLNPYEHAPDSQALAELRAGYPRLWEQVEHKTVPAIYPPGAQFLFSLLPASVTRFRVALVGFEMITLLLLLRWLRHVRLPSANVIVYAWLPLALVEIGANGHLEALFLPFAVAGMFLADRSRHPAALPLSSYCLSVAACVKYVAVVPLAFVIHREIFQSRRRWPVIAGLVLIPVVVAVILKIPLMAGAHTDGFSVFVSRWEFNGSLFRAFQETAALWLEPIPAKIFARTASAVLAVLLAFYLTQQSLSLVERTVFCYVGVLLLSPLVYPWYMLWFAPLLPLIQRADLRLALLTFCSASFLSYEVLSHPDSWKLSVSLTLLQVLPIAILLAGAAKRRFVPPLTSPG